MEDLHGKRVGVVLGYSYPPSITENPNLTLDYAPDLTLTMNKLTKGRFDILLETQGAF